MTAKDIIVIGSGPAGYTAAIYAARAMLDVVVFEGFSLGGTVGGQLMTTGLVENYPGFADGIDGQALMVAMRQQAQNSGAELFMADIVSIKKDGDLFVLSDHNGESFSAKAIIVATGAAAKRLDLDSERKFWAKGISACAVCDGGLPIFRNKPLAVIGGGDSAIEEAIYLTKFASKVYLIHRRSEFRASKIMQKHLAQNQNIEIMLNKTPIEFYGDKLLSGIKLQDIETGETSDLEVAGCFEAIGNTPNSAIVKDLVNLDENGYILVDANNMTNISGIFAAGDVSNPNYKQAIIAAGNGAKAALAAEKLVAAQAITPRSPSDSL